MQTKMYILVKNSLPIGMAASAIAHASLGTYLNFEQHGDMQYWLRNSFKKVVCGVSDEEFEAAKQYERHTVFNESTLNGNETAIGFCPREIYPVQFLKYKLYQGSKQWIYFKKIIGSGIFKWIRY